MSPGSRGQKKQCMNSAAAMCVSWLLRDPPWHEGSCTSAAHTPESPSFALGGVCGACCDRGIRCFPPHRWWPSEQSKHTVPHSSLQKHRGLQDNGASKHNCKQEVQLSGFYSRWLKFCCLLFSRALLFTLICVKDEKRKPCSILVDDSWLVSHG